MINTPENINIFIAYSREDVSFLEELRTQLNVLERIGLVDKIWYDGLIEAGADWEQTILNALHNSDIILLLVSADFIASNFSYEKEMQEAIRLHQAEKVHAIPVIVRQCLWEQTPFGKLSVLPKGGFPIASAHWKTKEEPYVQVVEAVQEVILQIKKKEQSGDVEQNRATYTSRIEEGDRYFSTRDWSKAQNQYKEALMLFQHGFQPSLHILNTKIDTCQNELLYRLNFEKGEKAYSCSNYKDAIRYFNQALSHKNNDSEALRLLKASDQGLVRNQGDQESPKVVTNKPDNSPTKFLQIKIFGIEIFKLVLAFSTVGVLMFAGQRMLNPNVYYSALVNNGRVVFVDDSGDVQLKTEYIDGKPFDGKLAAVQNAKGKWGYINKKAKMEIPFNYDRAWPHSKKEGLAYVQKEGMCGFINRQGSEVIPLKYLDAASFSEGLAMVKKEIGSFSFINKKGVEVITGLDSVLTEQFRNNEAVVIKDGNKMTIDRNGKCLQGCRDFVLPKEKNIRDRKRLELYKLGMKLKENKDYDRAAVKLIEAKRYVQTPEEEREIGNQLDLVQRKLKAAGVKRAEFLIQEADAFFKNKNYRAAFKKYKMAFRQDDSNVYVRQQLSLCKEKMN